MQSLSKKQEQFLAYNLKEAKKKDPHIVGLNMYSSDGKTLIASYPKPTRTPKKKKGLNNVRKTSRAALVRKLDKLVSEYTRMRETACVICGSTERLQNGHLFSRQAYSTRWDITEDGNCHTQCSSCNMSHEYDPYPYYDWYQMEFGKKKFDELHRRYKTPVKFSDFQLVEMIDALKKTMEVMD